MFVFQLHQPGKTVAEKGYPELMPPDTSKTESPQSKERFVFHGGLKKIFVYGSPQAKTALAKWLAEKLDKLQDRVEKEFPEANKYLPAIIGDSAARTMSQARYLIRSPAFDKAVDNLLASKPEDFKEDFRWFVKCFDFMAISPAFATPHYTLEEFNKRF